MDFQISVQSDRRWSYANAGTKRPVVKEIVLHWNGALPAKDATIKPRVTLNFPLPELVAPVWEAKVPRVISAKGTLDSPIISWEHIDLKLNYPLLGRLQEKVRGFVHVEIVDVETEQVLASSDQELELLTPNEFRHEMDYFETIAAFVLPTDPFVAEILKSTRSLLNSRTGNSATEGYQSDDQWNPQDPRPFLENSRALAIASAIYDAMSAVGYDYSNPQGYFDDGAQLVRTPSQIKGENCATCLDSAVLMASCFAQAGLEPAVFLIRGHAFAGYFTGKPIAVGDSFLVGEKAVRFWLAQIRQVGQSQLLKSRDNALIQQLLREQHILPIETTTTTRSMPKTFTEACSRQNNFSVVADQIRGIDDSTLEAIVAVRLAWQSGVTPPIVLGEQPSVVVGGELPTGVGMIDGFEELIDDVQLEDAVISPQEREIPPRIRQWMSSLLDLSSRNPLLKIKPKQIMEFEVPAEMIGLIDDALHTPKKRIKLPGFSSLPSTWIHNGVTSSEFEIWSKREVSLVFPQFSELNSLQRSLEQFVKDVRSNPEHPNRDMSDAELIHEMRLQRLSVFDAFLDKSAKKLIDKANDVMLTTGNNSLYLALGTVAWSETSGFRGQNKSTDFCAPLYLYPVILDGGKGRPWSIKLDPNGEVTPNFCLHEKLKRPPYNIDLQELVNPDEDEKGIDFDKMVVKIRKRLAQAKLDNVAVQPRAVLGVFDYATFRLWKDLRDDWKKMAEISPVFKHISYTANVPYTGNPPIPENRLEPLLPIAADDSQREAVQLALDGQSYKLEGPPGTGKSQTITNLLASCIAHNLKVLFVAQKQTALNAVKDRLDSVGLGVFSLNLHSNGDSDTKLRKNISAALTSALNANVDPAETAWKELEFRMSREEAVLNRYRASLHDSSDDQMSAWSASEQLLEVGEGPLVQIPTGFVDRFGEVWPSVQEASVALEDALDLVPGPANHRWRFVGQTELTPADRARLSRSLKAVLALAEALGEKGLAPGGIRSTITTESLERIGVLAQLSRSRMLPDVAVLSSFGSTNSSTTARKFRDSAEKFVEEARRMCGVLNPNGSVVSPTVLARSDRNDIRDALNQIDSDEVRGLREKISGEWLRIAVHAQSIESVTDLQPLSATLLDVVVKGIEHIESANDNAEFSRIISELRILQSRLKEHENNVNSDVISRSDLVDIEFRLKEASEAGILSRGRKVKALRELIGPLAKTSDDKLLLNSLTQVVVVARSVRELADQVRSKFPEVKIDGLQLWKEADINKLSDGLLSARISVLREKNLLPTSNLDDRAYLASLKVLATITPLVEVARQNSRDLLPSASPSDFKPWIEGEFERFWNALLEARSNKVLALLGKDALSTDARQVVIAARTFLDNAEAVENLDRLLKTDIFPGYPGGFKGWDPDQVVSIEKSIHLVGGLIGRVESSDLAALEFIGQESDAEHLGQLSIDASRGWQEFKQVLPSFQVEEWLGSRPLLTAVSEDWPALVRDAGQNDNFIEFQRWQELQSAISKVEKLGLGASIPELLSLQVSPNEFLTNVRRSALAQALRQRMEDENLDRFDRKVHERRITAFEAAQADARRLLNQRIPGLAATRRRARRLPSGEQRGATQDLLRGLSPKRGDKTPIRDLISRYGNALAEVMPCFLMSPDSVASLVPVGSIAFDLVVFDEASQIRTSHAVGALGRGRAGIVVGDSRQMPPSVTFSSNSGAFVEDDDVTENDPSELDDDVVIPVAARDAESILSEFEESEFPQRQLLCHYRSKDEVLISFSNTFIYPEPMLTFPSTMGMQSTALRFVHVPDGKFERDKRAKALDLGPGIPAVPALRTNLREAELIVDEVLRRVRDPHRRARRESDPSHSAESIIIVTFNVPQMNLVSELLKSRDPALFERVTTSQKLEDEQETLIPPQVKIRNLENVQGDEAETVIFSVAFSKTPEGKFPLNFGPVTRTGGDRRLNVAVTRAQREMIVYTSFLPEEMGAGGATLGEETRLLQQFLKLAYRGVSAAGDVGISVPRSRHIESMARELRELGFEVQTQLGLSTLRVDLALRRPGSERWEIAVMVDDTCWANRGSAFQRELLPRQVLPALGWKRVYRVWLPSWMNSKSEILEELRALLNADLDQEVEVISVDSVDEVSDESDEHVFVAQNIEESGSNVVGPVNEFEVFHAFVGVHGNPDVLAKGPDDHYARREIVAMISKVLDVEAPIEVNRLGKAVCRGFGFNRVTPARIEQIISLVPKNQIKKDAIGRFAWKSKAEWETWTRYRTSVGEMARSAEEISVFEYGNALVDFVERAHSLDYEEAIRELANAFGFQRVSAQIKSAIEAAIRATVKAGRLVQEGKTLHPAPASQ